MKSIMYYKQPGGEDGLEEVGGGGEGSSSDDV